MQPSGFRGRRLRPKFLNTMELIRDPEWQLAYDFVQFTHRHVFLTGRAGTGKTTFLHALKEKAPKRMVVVAPTGVAAINAGGVTIHSFFQLPFGPLVPGMERKEPLKESTGKRDSGIMHRVSREKINIIRSLDLLVIDEVSMVRADLLDAIDSVLRRYRHSRDPFGGVQLLMIGDLQQLAPVIKPEEWELLREYYSTGFFFGSQALQRTSYISIELKRIFRQRDEDFITILNRIRDNRVDHELLQTLNKRYLPGFSPDDNEGYITLTTHNVQARELNELKLAELKGEVFSYEAKIEGDFPAYAFPTEPELFLKKGAQVMFVKNDPSPEKRFYNGRIGRITEIGENELLVFCEGDEEEISVVPLEWQNMKYSINSESKEIEEEQVGLFTQIPLRLAWAITIHKSQGLTFDKVVIDARAAFAHGQVYVALSRCRTLGGLVLSSPVGQPGIISDQSVREFSSQLTAAAPGKRELDLAKKEYQVHLLFALFDFDPVLTAIRRCKRIAEEHGQVFTGKPAEVFRKMEETTQVDIIQVAGRFGVQLRQLLERTPDAETDPYLQERVKAAIPYFLEKTGMVLGMLDQAGVFESDNKAVHRSMEEETDRLHELSREKSACLETTRDGFNVKRLLRSRALAALKPARERRRKKADPAVNAGIPDRRLMDALRAWRNSRSAETGVPAYMVLSVKSMEAVAALCPADYSSLMKIKGIGKKKIEQYGREILELVYAHTGKDLTQLEGVELPFEKEKAVTKSKDHRGRQEQAGKKAEDTAQVTLKLFREGMKPEEIAGVRGITQSTVYRHLSGLVSNGMLNPEEVLGEEKKQYVERWFRQHPGGTLKAARADLGPGFSYDEIRLIAAGIGEN